MAEIWRYFLVHYLRKPAGNVGMLQLPALALLLMMVVRMLPPMR
jgi:hypothetical protein